MNYEEVKLVGARFVSLPSWQEARIDLLPSGQGLEGVGYPDPRVSLVDGGVLRCYLRWNTCVHSGEPYVGKDSTSP